MATSLHTPPTDPLIAKAFNAFDVDGREYFQERAAVREYEGEMDRQQAEVEALIETIEYLNTRSND